MTYQLIHADSTAIDLPDDSVDLIVTSPPYFALRSYQDGGEHYDGQIGSEDTPQAFLEALWAVTAECRRVLKPSGSMFVNLGDKYSGAQAQNTAARNGDDSARTWQQTDPKRTGIPNKSLMMLPHRYAIGCIDQLDLILRADIIWSKPNGLPESVTDRVRRSHEDWFHLVKSPRYFTGVDEIREAVVSEQSARALSFARGTKEAAVPGQKYRQHRTDRPDVDASNPLGKLPGSVWTVPTEPLRLPLMAWYQPGALEWDGVAHESDRSALSLMWDMATEAAAAGQPFMVQAPDHFAAFPSEWPRRLILGWSPSGICVECGQGRRPVVDKNVVGGVPFAGRDYRRLANGPSGGPERPTVGGSTEATITGYACDCPTPDAPTRPATVLDPFCGTGTTPAVAHHLGRHGIGIDLSADYLRVAHWRCERDDGLRSRATGTARAPRVPEASIQAAARLL